MQTETKEKVYQKTTRTPKKPESIFKGALSLPLEDRVELRNQLTESIVAEVEALEAAAEKAKKLSNGNK
jgi:hypothetical protein